MINQESFFCGGCNRRFLSMRRMRSLRARRNALTDQGRLSLSRAWDLTLKAPDHEYPSWIEIRQRERQAQRTDGRPLGQRPAAAQDRNSRAQLTFVSPKEEEESKEDMVFQGSSLGKNLPARPPARMEPPGTGLACERPTLDENSRAEDGGSRSQLFNGKDLTGWKMEHRRPPVVDRPEWKPDQSRQRSGTDQRRQVQDFKLHIEFNCGTESNSGVYLRGRYEVQIETESQAEPPSHHTGGVYGFLAPSPEQPRTPDVWQTFDITLIGRRVTVVHNGKTVINDQEIPGITGGALNSHEALAGADLSARQRKRPRSLSQNHPHACSLGVEGIA